jgi:hypothetical protein
MSEREPGLVDAVAAGAIFLALTGFVVTGATMCSTDNLKHDIRKCVAAGATLEACYKQYAEEK